MHMTRQPWDITPDMFLQPHEVDRLLAAVRTAETAAADADRPAAALDRLIVEVLLFAGLRTSEFCRLRLADTSVATGTPNLYVRPAGRDRTAPPHRAADRGDDPAAGRTVWLPADVDALIRDFVRRHRPALLSRGTRPDDLQQPLAVNERGHAFERTGLYRRVVRILSAAGLAERASVQLLRHTYGYLAYLRTGGNLLFVQRQLGHAHPMITTVYAQLVTEDYAALAARVAAASTSSTTSTAPAGRAQRVAARPSQPATKETPCPRKRTSHRRSAR
jgi:site-specific recombinase XerD